MRDFYEQRAWDLAGRQVDEWNARFREEREARWAAADARQDERDDELREYIMNVITDCALDKARISAGITDMFDRLERRHEEERDLYQLLATVEAWEAALAPLDTQGPPAFWSYENHRGNITWRLAQIADDE